MSNDETEITPIEKLTKYADQGFLFHGSIDPTIQTLEPRPANDTDPNAKFNIDTAIFATQKPNAAIIFGCMDLSNVPKEIRNGSWSVGMVTNKEGKRIEAKIPRIWREYLEKNFGYVYVLEPNTFTEKSAWQAKSHSAVKPIDKVTVHFSDFEKMGGVIVWED